MLGELLTQSSGFEGGFVLVAGQDGERGDHHESDELGEVGEIGEISPGKKKEKEDKNTGQNQGSLDFIKHGDGKEEEVTKEKEGGGKGAGFGN